MTKLLANVVKKVRESISFIHVHHYNHLFLPMLEAQTAMEFELCDKKLFPASPLYGNLIINKRVSL